MHVMTLLSCCSSWPKVASAHVNLRHGLTPHTSLHTCFFRKFYRRRFFRTVDIQMLKRIQMVWPTAPDNGVEFEIFGGAIVFHRGTSGSEVSAVLVLEKEVADQTPVQVCFHSPRRRLDDCRAL